MYHQSFVDTWMKMMDALSGSNIILTGLDNNKLRLMFDAFVWTQKVVPFEVFKMKILFIF